MSSWSRAYSAPQPQPPLKQGMNEDDASSSACLSCARLERKVAELQEQLSHLRHRRDMEDQSVTEQLDSDTTLEEEDGKCRHLKLSL